MKKLVLLAVCFGLTSTSFAQCQLLGRREATNAPVLLWLARPMVGELEARQQAARRQLNDLYLLAIRGKLELECFCVPQRCHGEHVKRVLETASQARGFTVAPSKILA